MRRNLVANIAGTAVSGLVAVALVPLYVRFLGIEAFGLLAFYASVTVVVTLLDFGLGATVNREIAMRPGHGRAAVRAAEPVYFAISLAAGAALYLLAPWLAGRWFTPRLLSSETIVTALRLIAAAVALRFPYGLYSSALLGLQRHVRLNAIVIASGLLRAAVTVALLLWVARDVRVVLAGEAAVCLLQTGVAAVVAYRSLPKSSAPAELRPPWDFARTVAAIGVFSAVVAQVDKLVVSRLLPLADFGAYAVAVTIGGVVATIAAPIHATAFPRFAQLLATGDDAALRQAFRDVTHVFILTVVPAAAVAAFFSRELIGAWTGDAALAGTLRWVAALIAAGSAFYAAMSLPYALQLAHGWLTPSIVKTLGSMLLLVPATIWGVWRFGAAGAAGAWLAVNALALAYDVVATHRRLLPGALWRWFSRDAGLPAVAVIAVCAVARNTFDAVPIPPLAVLVIAGLLALSAAALTIRFAARPGTRVRSSPR